MRLTSKYFPVLNWARDYDSEKFGDDFLAAVIVMVMLIPQSLAYALIAGLPPEMGLYASVGPLIAYSIFGTSRTLSVGPVAVVSLMTAAALSKVTQPESADYITAAIALAFLSGLFLLMLGVFKLGFLANFLSHPVVNGFITASALIIALTQLPQLLGLSVSGHNLLALLPQLRYSFTLDRDQLNLATILIGFATIGYLIWARLWMKAMLQKFGLSERLSNILARISPIFAVVLSSVVAFYLDLGSADVLLVGQVPVGMPGLTIPRFSLELWLGLITSAVFISTIGFVESISVAQGLAAKNRERVDPSQELIALGTANLSASVTGGFPVAGGFSRSVVNFDAGAATPAAGFFAALLIAMATYLFMPALAYLPKATLAATIVVAVWSLIDFSIVKEAWKYSKADFLCVITTISLTLLVGVEIGVASGVLLSVLMQLVKTSKPHIAVVGRVSGTEHFRNINRHQVLTSPGIMSLRIDESLYFSNSRYLEDFVYQALAGNKELKHVVLMCNAVNEIDMSAVESLLAINENLRDAGIQFHLSEIKGPVMDKLEKTQLLEKLSGNIYMSQHQAIEDLA